MSETKLCKNCNSEITENYCSHCGQELKDMNLSIFSFIKEFLGNLFSLDSKVLVTIKYLLTRPGVLSTEYIAGRRKQYTLPLRLYLFTSIISIILFSLLVEDTTRYLKFKNEGYGIAIAEDINGKAVQYIIWGGDLSESWEDIDDEPLQFNVLSYIAKIFLFTFPIFALLMKCFYWKRLYIHHLILILHNHSFILINTTLIFLINKLFNLFGYDIINGFLIFILVLLVNIYLYISTLRFYNTGKIITLIKYLPLAISYLFVLIISIATISKLFYSFPNIIK